MRGERIVFKENYVSLWLGNFTQKDVLKEYVDTKFDEDGDVIPSVLRKDFELGYYNIDFLESDFVDNGGNNLRELLDGFSYDCSFVGKIAEITGAELSSTFNGIILIYDYEYTGEKKVSTYKESEIQFIATTSYEK